MPSAVDHPRRQRQLLGRRADARQRRVPDHPRRVVDRVGAAVGQRAAGRAQRPARRPDRRGRRHHRRGDAAAELPRAPAQRPQRRPRPTSTCASPSSAPSTAKQVLDTAALGEGEITGPITSPAYRSDPNSRPCPTRDLDKATEYLAAAGKPDGVTIKTIVSQGEYATVGQRGAEPPGPAGRRRHHARPRDPRVGRLRRPLARRRLRRRGRAQRRPPRPGRHVRPLLHQHRQPQQGRRLLLARARRAVRPGQGDQRPGRAQAPIYTQISDELEDNAVWIWLFTSYTYTATTPNVSGFVPMANGSLQYLRRRARPAARRSTTAGTCSRKRTGAPHGRRLARPGSPCSGSRSLVFVMLRVIPGDQITAGLGTEAAALTPGQLAALRRYYGLDEPLVPAVLLAGSATCSPATSATPRAPGESSLRLTAARCRSRSSWPSCRRSSAWSIGIPLGMLSASKPHSVRDAAGQVVGLAGLSIPASCSAPRC